MQSSSSNPIDVQVNGSVVYFSGIIKGPFTWNQTLKGYLIGTLPSTLRPEKRLVFITPNNFNLRIDITHEGHILVLSRQHNLRSVNLNGIRYSLAQKSPILLKNGWKSSPNSYRSPSLSHHQSIVYLSGIIKNGPPNEVFATLPPQSRPAQKLIFIIGEHPVANLLTGGPLTYLEIDPSGDCIVHSSKNDQSTANNWYSLDSISFNVNNEKSNIIDFNLPNGWSSAQKPYICVNDNIVQMSGIINGNLEFIGKLRPSLAPKNKLIFQSIDLDNPNNIVRVEIHPNGDVKKLSTVKQSPKNTICLNNISYIRQKSQNMQQGGANGTITIGSLSGFDQFIVDGPNYQFVDLAAKVSQTGKIIQWSVDVGRIGSTSLQVYRPSTVDANGNGTYQLIAEYVYSFTQTGINNITIPDNQQLPVQVGDFIGWKDINLGTIKFKRGMGNVKWWQGNSPGLNQLVSFVTGEPRAYAYMVTIQVTDQSQTIANCQIIPGYDFTGNDISGVPSSSLEDCANKCQQNPNCKGFSRLNDTGMCWTKTTMENKTPANITSGLCTPAPLPTQIGSCQIVPAFDFTGNDISGVPSSSLEDCANKCQQNPNCKGFSRLNDTGMCWTKTTMTNKTPANITSGLCAPTPLPTQIGNCQIVPAYDFTGNDITGVPSSSLEDCANKCQQNPNCKGFSRLNDTGMCWIKTTMENKTPANITSGLCIAPPQQINNCQIVPNTDFSGNDISSANSASLEECSSRCQQDPNCQGFVRAPSNGACWIKSKMENKIINHNDRTAGLCTKVAPPAPTGNIITVGPLTPVYPLAPPVVNNRNFCEGDYAANNLTCPPNQTLTVNKFLYGRPDLTACANSGGSQTICAGKDYTTTIQSLVKGNTLTFSQPINILVHDDPCPGVYKQIQTQYTCTPSAPSQTGFENAGVDTAQNIQFIDLNGKIPQAGIITQWNLEAGALGETILQVYRPVTTDANGNGSYRLIAEYNYTVKQLGINQIPLPQPSQISVQAGDFIGWRYPAAGTIKYKQGSGSVRWLYGNSPGINQLLSFAVGEPRVYAYAVIINISTAPPAKTDPIINTNEIGGSPTNPARSAQQILDEYTKKGLNIPVDGTYWIRVYDYLPAQQIYCNFSTRKGSGYMLVASVTDQTNWLPATSPSLPLSPALSYGTYQIDGTPGNYYRPWSEIDLNTILDKEPDKCHNFGYNYNTDGQFCGLQIDEGMARLNINGGLTEFLFMTGNGKYWIVISRKDVPGQVTKEAWKKIPSIDSSKNFEGDCNPNTFVYIISRPGVNEDPWINAGDAHKCGNNYMFWGMNNYNAYQEFKNKNGGIRLFVGGPVSTTTLPSKFPHNPTHHVAPNKTTYTSSYADAMSTCSALGKKVCSLEELTTANKAGYSSCACGWTSDKVDDKYWVGYPTNIDTWVNLNRGADRSVKGAYCGVPGMNRCGLIGPNEGIYGHPGADIYCCDRFDFSNNFDLLDTDYLQATSWITEIESLFNSMYGQDIPSPIDFLAYGDNGFGVAVTKKGQVYDLINSEIGRAPTKLPNIRCQLPQLKPFGADRRAVFLNDIATFNIVKNQIWPLETGKIPVITYGSQIRLSNILNNMALTTQEINYYHPGSSQKTQVMGTQVDDNSSLWLIKTQRGQGKLDNQGYGDEKYNFGTPVKNGDIIRLESALSSKNLHSDIAYRSPSGRQEVYLNEKGKLGNSNDHWKVELIDSQTWTVNTQFKLIHVNTNAVLFSDSTTYQPNPNTNLTYIEVSANSSRGPGDTWKIQAYNLGQPVVDKCKQLTHLINKLNLQIKSFEKNGSSPQLNDLKQQKQKLIYDYNVECRRVSMYDYKRYMAEQEAKIYKVEKAFEKETQKLEQITDQWNAMTQKQQNLEDQYKNNNQLYQQLLNKCRPVTNCVPEIGQGLQIPPQCQKIMNQLENSRGKITDDIAAEIKKMIIDSDNINNYKIQDHPDYYKLIENRKIKPCPKSSKQ